jgi:hypothetical protein
MKLLSLLGVALLSGPAAAQDLCEGNGYGEAYIEVGPAYLGGFFSHDLGSPAAPNSFVVFSFSDGFTATTHPVLGPVCLDVLSPVYGIIVLPTDGNGNVHFDLFLPAIPSWVSLPPFYSNAATFEAGQWSSSKTVPLWFENKNSWTPVAPMASKRLYHTATNLGADGKADRIKVLIAGGGGGTVTEPTATDTTEIFDPLSRTSAAGPTLLVQRSTHTATLLQDGRVLLAGGLQTGGVCHRSCELYDRTTDTLTQTGDMTTERAGHVATLLDDGRVLVTGGFQDYQNLDALWSLSLNTAQDTAEIYDPATGVWTPVLQPMASKRAGHSSTKLNDGRVLLVGGVSGGSGSFPLFTGKVELFDPATQTFSPLPDIPFSPGAIVGRAFHGASLLGNGDVLVTGGMNLPASGGAISIKDCKRWNGSAWVDQAALPVAVAWHNQVTLENGNALVSGGIEVGTDSLGSGNPITPRAFTGLHLGTTVAPLNAIGLNPGIPGAPPEARGAMSVTRLHDGSLLFLGGWDATAVLDSGYVYTPNP